MIGVRKILIYYALELHAVFSSISVIPWTWSDDLLLFEPSIRIGKEVISVTLKVARFLVSDRLVCWDLFFYFIKIKNKKNYTTTIGLQ